MIEKRGVNRVVRGGSWNNNGRNVRSAIRNHNVPDNRNDNMGFRLSLAQHTAGWRVNDQILILSRRLPPGKNQGHRRVGRASGCRPKARRMTDFVIRCRIAPRHG